MTVLHFQAPEPLPANSERTPLERSLCAQHDPRWALDPSPSDPAPIATVLTDANTELHPEAVGVIIDALQQRTDAGGLIADAWVAGRERRRSAWSPAAVISDPTDLTLIVVRHKSAKKSEPLPVGLAGRLAAAKLLIADRATVLHIPAALSTHPTRALVDQEATDTLDRLAATTHPGTTLRPGKRPATFILHRTGPEPSVSVIIPTAGTPGLDGSAMAIRAASSVLAEAGDDLEVLMVVGDEYRGDPDQLLIDERVRLVRRPSGPFNFSTAINWGLIKARRDLVLLLNDDTESSTPGWLSQMAVHLADSTVGAVGACLLFADQSIQHAGMVIDDAHPLHSFVGRPVSHLVNHHADVARDVIAATGACLLTRRSDATRVGGFATAFPLSFNDVDFCLKLHRTGLRVVQEPDAVLIHHESASRNASVEPTEWDAYIRRWGEVVDPWYHPGHHRPDNPQLLSLNADHLDPEATPFVRIPRDATICSRVHHSRIAAPEPAESRAG